MPETILFALLCAKLKGYKIKPLFKTWVIYPVIIFEVFFLVEQAIIFSGNYKYIEFTKSLNPLYLCTYLLLVFKYNTYKSSILGAICMVFGGLLNDIAIKANNGFMPVYPTLSYITGYASPNTFNLVNDIHMLGNLECKMKILTDYIDIGYSILSIGDVFIRIFVFVIIFASIKEINKQRRNEYVEANNV